MFLTEAAVAVSAGGRGLTGFGGKGRDDTSMAGVVCFRRSPSCRDAVQLMHLAARGVQSVLPKEPADQRAADRPGSLLCSLNE